MPWTANTVGCEGGNKLEKGVVKDVNFNGGGRVKVKRILHQSLQDDGKQERLCEPQQLHSMIYKGDIVKVKGGKDAGTRVSNSNDYMVVDEVGYKEPEQSTDDLIHSFKPLEGTEKDLPPGKEVLVKMKPLRSYNKGSPADAAVIQVHPLLDLTMVSPASMRHTEDDIHVIISGYGYQYAQKDDIVREEHPKLGIRYFPTAPRVPNEIIKASGVRGPAGSEHRNVKLLMYAKPGEWEISSSVYETMWNGLKQPNSLLIPKLHVMEYDLTTDSIPALYLRHAQVLPLKTAAETHGVVMPYPPVDISTRVMKEQGPDFEMEKFDLMKHCLSKANTSAVGSVPWAQHRIAGPIWGSDGRFDETMENCLFDRRDGAWRKIDTTKYLHKGRPSAGGRANTQDQTTTQPPLPESGLDGNSGIRIDELLKGINDFALAPNSQDFSINGFKNKNIRIHWLAGRRYCYNEATFEEFVEQKREEGTLLQAGDEYPLYFNNYCVDKPATPNQR